MAGTNGEKRSKHLAAVRCGLITAVAVSLFGTLGFWFLGPLNAQGVAPSLTSFLTSLDRVCQFPGLEVGDRAHIGTVCHPGPRLWLVSLAVNFLLWFAVGFLLYLLWCWDGPPKTAAASDPHDKTMTRRAWLRGGVRLASLAPGASLVYGLAAEPRWFSITHQDFPVRDLPPSLDGLRFVQLTDLHHNPWLPIGHIHEIVRATNRLEPDLVLLTGDYIDQSSAYIAPVAAALGRLRPRIGAVAVLGNHDWLEGAELVRREFARHGLPLIDNARRILTPDRQLVETAPHGLALCGVGDYWYGKPDYRAALAGLPAAMPRLLLSHNPDVAEHKPLLRSGFRVDLILSGHTHGGQICLPGAGPLIVPSLYGNKYASGMVRGPICPVFVSRGIGESGVPIRFNAMPEVTVFELRAA